MTAFTRVAIAGVASLIGVIAPLSASAAAERAAPDPHFHQVTAIRVADIDVRRLPPVTPGAHAAGARPFLRLPAIGSSTRSSAVPVTTSGGATLSAVTTGSTEEVLTGFSGVTYSQQVAALGSDQAVTPPDTQVAAGPTAVLEMVNDSGSIWTKSGSFVSIVDLNTFFKVPTGYTFSDPRVLYDAISGRFFASGVAFVTPSFGSVLVFGLSDTSDPSGTWHIYSADNSSNVTHDQPKIGVSTDKVAFSFNDFLNASFFQGASTWVFSKSAMLQGASSIPGQATGPDSSRVSIVPAIELTAISTEYMTYNNSDCSYSGCNRGTPTIGVVALTGDPAAGTLTWNETDPAIAGTSQPPKADQPGAPGSIDTNDDRFLTAVWENGVLWSVGNDACTPSGDTGVRPCPRLIQVTTGTSTTVNQNFDLGRAGGDLYYPAVHMDSAGDMFVVYNISSTSDYVGVRLTGQLAGSAPQVVVTAQTVQPGQGLYSCASRWGDYSGASLDPTAPSDVWLAGEYAAASSNNCNWATFVVRMTFSAPTVTGISPASGSAGTQVTVTGTDFTSTATVQFGATAATAVSVTSPAQLVATAPAGSGTVDVTVTTADGTSAMSSSDQFCYGTCAITPAPVITSLTPQNGPATGGTGVSITGTNLSASGATTFANFGPNQVTATCTSSTSCTAASPAGVGGPTTLSVTVNGQTSNGVTFTYIPSLSSLSQTLGPVAGGNTVTITGAGFSMAAGATVFTFGSSQATGVTCTGLTSCSAVVPAAAVAGPVAVTVAVNGQAGSSSLTYSYQPSLSSISPTKGTHSGGTTVTISGSGFAIVPGATGFSFGSNPATGVSCASMTSCTAVTPAGTAGTTVAVTVTVNGVAGTNSLSFRYR